jgi:hypothetical protein
MGAPAICFGISERWKFDVRGEFYNLLNHTNFNLPGPTFGASDFGVVGSSRSPRREALLENNGRTFREVAGERVAAHR